MRGRSPAVFTRGDSRGERQPGDEHASPFPLGEQAAPDRRPHSDRSRSSHPAAIEWGSTSIFYLASFERDSQMTIVCDGIGRKLLGHASSTYTVAPAACGSRMVLKLAWIPPGGRLLGAVCRPTLPWFDLFMMRKQFLNPKRLAERTAATA
jgi:hypothetical protein